MRSDTIPISLVMAPGPLPRPAGRPPVEPIIIRTPPRPHDDREIERPDDMDEGKSGEISDRHLGFPTNRRQRRPRSARSGRSSHSRVSANRRARSAVSKDSRSTAAS